MIIVRRFEESDADNLAALMMEMVEFYSRPLAVQGSVRDDIVKQAKNVHILVALANDQVAAFATYGFLYPVAGLRSFAYLQQIYVGSSFRRLGLAKQLMAFVARDCRDKGCTWMEWNTGIHNTAARTFYEGLGAKGSEKIAFELEGAELNKLADMID
ncbi:GNAT family N-acetyltransferase [Microvirga sp. ACRRW]|uniref:GNAT family N-acetyltransferase n=1 Tax=Microvirga sp. ACRRW TaxID=2918205 RepID=UPI001EF6450B|nr:GNAT family N-acetyltransferase [Microvirga sp. ACRRW]MCG7394624.1 GNAT family N-acetyltransferase [Microvirga sp. ACRRW]